MRPQAPIPSVLTRVRQSYHWRWLAGAIRAAPFMAGGPWPLLASLLIGVAIAYLATPPKSDPMNAVTALMEQGVIATFAVLAAFVVLQLVLTPRRMAKREQDDAEAREEQLRSHIAALTPAVADAVLAPDVLAVEPYREPRHSGVSPKALGLALGLEYRNISSSRLEGCAVMWEKFQSLVHDDQEDWSEVDWFERHWLTWDNTDEREARIATGQPRRVELVERYPGTGTVAYVRLPGHEKPWLIQPGRYRVSVGVVAIGYRQRPEQWTIAEAAGATWDELVALLDEGGYVRYDFRVHGPSAVTPVWGHDRRALPERVRGVSPRSRTMVGCSIPARSKGNTSEIRQLAG